jgi:hypothetical protein
MAKSRTVLTAPGRLILGLMTFTIAFSVIGDEIENGGPTPGAPSQPGQTGYGAALTSVNQSTGTATKRAGPFVIIFGGTVATSLLTLLSHAGDAGEEFATGLALIAFLSSALVYGGPVWDRLNAEFGSKPTKPVAATTPSTPTTTPFDTATALAQVA